jgi:iron complex transport system ATP-binding protein
VILEARDLTIGYGRKVVGRGVNVAVQRGEVLALLGPNGGGKTTLLKTLLGLIPPLSGTVTLAGAPMQQMSVRDRSRAMAYVPQVHTGTFAFSVEDMVLMGRSAHASIFSQPSAHDRRVAAEALARLGISHLGDRPYTMISGGERQLVLIARALAQQPQMVVLDEPTASLDFGNQGKTLREIRRLAAAGLAVVFATHDPNHSLRYADRAMLIRDGQCVGFGSAFDVVTRENLRMLYNSDILQIGHSTEVAYLPG